VVTSLALSFADDYLESGRGMFCGASDVDHVDLLSDGEFLRRVNLVLG
jgi:hypothetical protein